MKNIDIKSVIIGVLLTTTIIFGMGATGKGEAGAWDDEQRWDVLLGGPGPNWPATTGYQPFAVLHEPDVRKKTVLWRKRVK